VNNNPLKYKDDTGEILPLLAIGAIIWGTAEIGLSAYDAYSTAQTVRDPNASLNEKLGAIGLFGLGLIGPGGGYKTIGSKADDAIKAIQSNKKLIDYTSSHGPQLGSKMNRVAENLKETSYKFTDHSIQRIAQKIGVGNEKSVINTLQNSKPFEYFHDGVHKLGYYNPLTKIFVGQAKDSGNIITVITNVGKNYINNLLK
jgi:histidinol phosphatase-like PHP family hydrolase